MFKNRFLGAVIGIEPDDRYLKIACGKHGQIYNSHKYELEDGIIVKGEIINKEAVKTIIKGYIDDNKIKIRNIKLLVKPRKIIVRHIKMPAILDREVRRFILNNKDEYIPQGDSYVFDYRVCGKYEGARSILLTAVQESVINGYIHIFGELGLRLAAVEVYSDCVSRVFDISEDEGAIILNEEETVLHAVALSGKDVILYEQFDARGDLADNINTFLYRYLLNTDMEIRKIFTVNNDYKRFEGLDLHFEYTEPFDFYALKGLLCQETSKGFLPDWYARRTMRSFVVKSMYIFLLVFLLILIFVSVIMSNAVSIYEDRTNRNKTYMNDEKYAHSNRVSEGLRELEAAYEYIQGIQQEVYRGSVINNAVVDGIFSSLPEGTYIVSIDLFSGFDTVTVKGIADDKKSVPLFTSNLSAMEEVEKVTLQDVSKAADGGYNYTVQLFVAAA